MAPLPLQSFGASLLRLGAMMRPTASGRLTSNLSPLISIYISLQGNSSDSILSRISTWKISNLHVDIFYSPRGRHSFPPKFRLIPPKFHFVPPWRIFIFHVDISKSPRGDRPFYPAPQNRSYRAVLRKSSFPPLRERMHTDLRLATDRNRTPTCSNYGSQPQPAADPPPSPAYR